MLKKHPLVTVHRGRMNREEMLRFIEAGNFAAVVDATHPYAEMVTENIKGAIAGAQVGGCGAGADEYSLSAFGAEDRRGSIL